MPRTAATAIAPAIAPTVFTIIFAVSAVPPAVTAWITRARKRHSQHCCQATCDNAEACCDRQNVVCIIHLYII